MNAVTGGTGGMGHEGSLRHHGTHPASSAFFAVPFGMTARERAARIDHGGGQPPRDEIGAMSDVRGLTLRLPGLEEPGGMLRVTVRTARHDAPPRDPQDTSGSPAARCPRT